MHRSFWILIAIASSLPGVTRGQVTLGSYPALVPGDTVRVVWGQVAPFGRARGALAGLDQHAMTVAEFSTTSLIPKVIPLDSIQRIQVKRGVRRSTALTAAATLVGVASGVLLGGAVAIKLLEHPPEYDRHDRPVFDFTPVFGALVGGILGGGVGGTVGYKVGRRPIPQWISVSLRR